MILKDPSHFLGLCCEAVTITSVSAWEEGALSRGERGWEWDPWGKALLVPLRGVKCHFNGMAAPERSKMQREMNQSCVNGGKCRWLLKANPAMGLSCVAQQTLKGWLLAGPRKMGEKLLAAGMSVLNFG